MENKTSVIIVGGGINGLCTAYFLEKKGYKVTLIDKDAIENNCSFGNMGYISPSHFVPLASPGIVAEGLKYMLDKKSPFYIKPRLDFGFMKWALAFYRSSNQKTADKNAGPLVELLHLSRKLMDDIGEELGDVFDMEAKGIMMMCHSKDAFEKQRALAEVAKSHNLDTIVLEREALQEYEPDVELDIYGSVLYTDDAHTDPGKLMRALTKNLAAKDINFQLNATVTGFEKKGKKVTGVITDKGTFQGDYIVLTPGSWLGELTKKLGHELMIQGGKGYSTTYDYVEKNIKYPAILVDGRCAITPWGHRLRIGGTMEFSGLNDKVLMNRMQGIFDSIKKFYPGLQIDFPSPDKIWTGLRPVSPDGLPYVGYLNSYQNVLVGGGHAMLGLTAGAGTGQILSQLINKEDTAIDIEHFRSDRFR